MSTWENGLYSYIEDRLSLLEKQGKCYFFRNNSFSGRIQRYDGSTGYIKNNKKGTPDVVVCFGQVHPDDMLIRQRFSYGQFVGLELKTLTGKQSPVQKEAQKSIENAGGIYKIIRTSEELEDMLKELL